MSRGKERVGHDHADEPESCDAKLAGSGPRHGQNLAGQRDQTGTLTTDDPTATSLSNACRRVPRTATLRDAAGTTPDRRAFARNGRCAPSGPAPFGHGGGCVGHADGPNTTSRRTASWCHGAGRLSGPPILASCSKNSLPA